MARTTGLSRRGEIVEQVDATSDELRKKEGELEVTVGDIEIIRETIGELRLDGTAEGMDEVKRSVDAAENVTEEIFDREDDELEGLQEGNEEQAHEYQERADTSTVDASEIGRSQAEVQTRDAGAELESARQSALDDVDFLKGVVDRARESGERSKEAQRGYEERRSARR